MNSLHAAPRLRALPSALASITLSISLSLGSTVALAAPPATEGGEVEAPPPETPESGTDTGVTAEQKSEAEALSEKAITEFTAKNYEGAVELFEQAYEVDPQPNYLFNIGRVYEEAGNLEKAVEFYAKFVKQPGVDINSREVALERLRVLRAILEETKEPGEEPEGNEPKDDETQQVVAPVPAPQDPVETEAQRKRKLTRNVGFGILGAGAAAVVGAAVVGSLAEGDWDEAFDRNHSVTLALRQEYLEKAHTKAVTADVLWGVGGALLLTGVIMVAVGFKKPKTERVAVIPSFGPRQGGMAGGIDLRMRF